ncbi:MAG: hypothetical protein IKQ15_04520 [Kiritimatiellae bacterium]|nr:hypothetical protein [Kiritimatiellia bacterium]
MKRFLDTNVFLYAFLNQDVSKKAVAARIVADAVRTGNGSVSVQVVNECGTQFYDSLMLAAAESAGCREILTEDLNDGQMYGTIKAVNPFKRL